MCHGEKIIPVYNVILRDVSIVVNPSPAPSGTYSGSSTKIPDTIVFTRILNPDPNWIRIQGGFWAFG
jgi:hypothetical protein